MDQVLALRPFVPAQDFDKSKRFYQALGFRKTMEDSSIAMLKMGGFSFILQNFYDKGLVENFMMQLMVRDVEAWWANAEPAKLVEAFGVMQPKPPAIQSWGMKVGFLADPSGILWHIAEALF